MHRKVGECEQLLVSTIVSMASFVDIGLVIAIQWSLLISVMISGQ